ncbi:MAG: hypothetical protein JSS72_11215 [Armatimonadetes bacterium]|nr:hypothetical protein [Armatimonadota bacterium]
MDNAFFVPILPGKTEAALAFAEALNTTRRAELDKTQVRVTKESWFLQETPMGDFLIICFTADDGNKVNESLTASQEPFDVWFKDQIMDITGIDANQPLPQLPKRIMSWSR